MTTLSLTPLVNLSNKSRVTIVLGSIVIYVLSFFLFFHLLKGSITVALLLPMIALSGLFGRDIGVIGSLVISILNIPLLALQEPFGFEFYTQIYFPNILVTLVVPLAVGQLRDLQIQMSNTEKDLRENESKIDAMLNTIPDLIFVVDNEGTIIDIHSPDESDLMRERVDMMNTNLLDYPPREHAEKMLEHVKMAMKTKKIQVYPYHLNIRGELKYYEGRFINIDETSTLVLIRNVTDLQNELQDKLELQNRVMRLLSSESLNLLASEIAHNFKNLMGIILGYAGMLGKKHLTDEEIATIGTRITEVVKNGELLVANLTQTSDDDDVVAEFDIHELLPALVGLLGNLIKDDIIINCRFLAEKTMVLGNRSHIYGSFLNIFLNARQHGLPNGGIITITTDNETNHEDLDPQKKYIRVSIADDGAGIEPEVLPLIFDTFFTTNRTHGTGLGLASVKQRVQEHGGLISVKSQPGRGTEFEIYLPLVQKES